MFTLKILCSGEIFGVMGVFGVALTDESILADSSFGTLITGPASASSDRPFVRFLSAAESPLPVQQKGEKKTYFMSFI